MKFYTLTFLILLATQLYGQTIRKCDRNILFDTRQRVGQLTSNEIRSFLLTFARECRDNIEYSELSNELLFTS